MLTRAKKKLWWLKPSCKVITLVCLFIQAAGLLESGGRGAITRLADQLTPTLLLVSPPHNFQTFLLPCREKKNLSTLLTWSLSAHYLHFCLHSMIYRSFPLWGYFSYVLKKVVGLLRFLNSTKTYRFGCTYFKVKNSISNGNFLLKRKFSFSKCIFT